MHARLTEELERELDNAASDDINVLNDNIVNVVKECVEKVCPKVQTRRKKEPWEDAALQEMMEEARRCKKRSKLRIVQKKIKYRRKWLNPVLQTLIYFQNYMGYNFK